MSKRSRGLTAFAIVMIIAGVWTALTSFYSVLWVAAAEQEFAASRDGKAMTGEPAHNAWDRLDATIEQLSESAAVDEISRAQLREQVEQLKQQVRGFVTGSRIRWVLGGFLGFSAFMAGIGLLRLKDWAGVVLVGQAVLSLGLGVWWFAAWGPFMLYLNSTPWLIAQLIRWGHLLFAIAWNAVVIWFVTRPSVTAQFETA